MVVIFCDASFEDDTKKCGCGIVIKQLIPSGIKETRIQIKDYAVDNNDAELKAILHGLEHVDKPTPETINIVTDSQVAIGIMNSFIHRADGKVDHVNPKYQQTAKRIYRASECHRIRLHHTKGHSNKHRQYSNIQAICDKLAKKARY